MGGGVNLRTGTSTTTQPKIFFRAKKIFLVQKSISKSMGISYFNFNGYFTIYLRFLTKVYLFFANLRSDYSKELSCNYGCFFDASFRGYFHRITIKILLLDRPQILQIGTETERDKQQIYIPKHILQ